MGQDQDEGQEKQFTSVCGQFTGTVTEVSAHERQCQTCRATLATMNRYVGEGEG